MQFPCMQDFALFSSDEGKRAFEDLDIGRRLMLKWILKHRMDVGWIVWLRTGTSGGSVANTIISLYIS